MPTVSGEAMPCPTDEDIPDEIPSGPIKLARSDSLCILTKARTDINGSLIDIAPIALSYDGQDWEKASGSVATEILYGQEIGSYTEGNQLYLPALTDGSKYYLTSSSHTVSEDDEVARLLEQGTFGTTAGAIQAFKTAYTSYSQTSAEQWVKDQMGLPVTSHREFLRTRTNMRLTNPVWMGRNSHPCDAMSRWRTYAFSRKEGDDGVSNPQLFEAIYNATGSATDSYITIKLNGHVRTVVTSIAFKDGTPLQYGVTYEICNEPREYEGGDVKLEVNGVCKTVPNPLVHFYEDYCE